MTTFDDREKAFEDKFRHDEDVLFRVRVRRDTLAGLWAAGLMGMNAAEAQAYARRIVEVDIGTPGPHDIRDRLSADLHAKGIDISDHRVEREMGRLLDLARRQVNAE
ncbi:DUF1476 domain-containing protein [Azospirillum doebereinerae]|uniref:DUF1476 domain-containing protein n=1 Tax=Azospirillum doebereinerae TaxID=92933 RepID=A0A433JE32_9PROT|nr:DUF1476 domain-containing protein [Azospirillum doebereinerae]MCG5239269.1 DUF1476 domain-containing protein [Azospirillum doebereinerae]RUQ75143.1 DUF1476 domain-containing protein [Azospirillum doebereinerae]